MGPVVEEVLSILVAHPNYEKLNNPSKEIVMREALRQIRSDVTEIAEQEDPERFAKVKMNKLKKAIRRLIERLE